MLTFRNMVVAVYSAILLGALFLLASIVYADGNFWACGNGFPQCNGNFGGWTSGTYYVKSEATNINWTSTRLSQIGPDPTFDIEWTGNCVNGMAAVRHRSVWTSLPNYGVFGYPKCNANSTELELRLNETSLSAGTTYVYGVEWNCLRAGNHPIAIEYRNGYWWNSPLQIQSTQPGCPAPLPFRDIGASNLTVQQNTLNNMIDGSAEELVYSGSITGYDFDLYQLDRTYKVVVKANFDSSNLDEYAIANRQFQKELDAARNSDIESKQRLVAVTFKAPLSHLHALDFTSRAGLKVIQYGVFGKVSGREIVVSSYFPSEAGTIEEFPAEFSTGAGIVSNGGIMTILAVTDNDGLDIIREESNIAFLDVSANIIQNVIGTELGLHIPVEAISVPNPSWIIYELPTHVPTSVQISASSGSTGFLGSLGIILFGSFAVFTLSTTRILRRVTRQ